MNVRGLYKSQWDLHQNIATHNPDVLVLTETKLRRTNKDRTWLDVLLKNYHHWSAFDWTGGTTICIRKTLALATQCLPTCHNSKGRIASVKIKGTNADLHLIGTYWPSGNSNGAIASRKEMQKQLQTLLDTHRDCTPLIIGDMNATFQTSDRSSNRTYRADRMYLFSQFLPLQGRNLQTLDTSPSYWPRQKQQHKVHF